MQPRHYYTVFMIAALAVFLIVRRLQTHPPALDDTPWWKRLGLMLAGFVGGALGAKVPFVVYGDEPWYVVQAWFSDGKTVTTALLGAYLGIELAKRVLDVRAKTGDGFAIPLALALSIGRFGCFFNGCCHGVAASVPWAVDFGDGVLRHPTQIYEVLFHLCAAVVLWRLAAANLFQWQRLKLYLIAYGLFRFLTEFIRPAHPVAVGLTFYQYVALVLIGVMVLHWIIDEQVKKSRMRSPIHGGRLGARTV